MPVARQLRQTMRSLVLAESPWPLMLSGGAGTGKSCAALCLLDAAGGVYFTAQEFCEALILAEREGWRSPWSEKPMSKIGLWEWVRTAPLVVADELGARQVISDFHYDNVKRVLDQRENLPLICISNLTLDQLAKVYDDRIASRLASGSVVELRGADRRIPS